MVVNKSVVFKKAPSGLPVEGEHLTIEQTEFDTTQAPPQGGITVKVNYLSLDPYMRGRLREGGSSYVPGFALDAAITNRGIATVLQTSDDCNKFSKGDVIVVGQLPFSEYVALDSETVSNSCTKLDSSQSSSSDAATIEPPVYLGALGMPGLTAYSSFYEIGKPQRGETILISAASGAVGQVVGQLAKHEGVKVIASVGDDKKLDFVTNELGFDCGFNYKKEKPADALKRLAPNGIDIYFENVGGEHLEAAIDAMNTHGRIIACGMISQYNSKPEDMYGVKNLFQVVGKRLSMRGFIVGDKEMGPKYHARHQEQVSAWIRDGSFKPKTDTTRGIDQGIKALLNLYSGANFGKAVLQVAPLEK